MNNPKEEIQVQSKTKCLLCGSTGTSIYRHLRDSLYHISGDWNFRRCSNSKCDLMWLDPSPRKDEIWKAYRTYYTHHIGNTEVLKFSVPSLLQKAYNLMLSMTPLKHRRICLYQMFLEPVEANLLLEIGCGDGNRLAHLKSMGWNVEGQEIDPVSAAYSRSAHGLAVHLGYLEDLFLDDNKFDAIIMNHVIEHVYNPILLLEECHRILRPQGLLVVVTPNKESTGHRLFKSSWGGLDPPRHLHLFCQQTLRKLAITAGFHSIQTWTTAANAQYTGEISLSNKYLGRTEYPRIDPIIGVAAVFYQLCATLVSITNRNSGEECVLTARKGCDSRL